MTFIQVWIQNPDQSNTPDTEDDNQNDFTVARETVLAQALDDYHLCHIVNGEDADYETRKKY